MNIRSITRPTDIDHVPRQPRLGFIMFPGANDANKAEIARGATLLDLAEDYVFPFAKPGDTCVWWYLFSHVTNTPTFLDAAGGGDPKVLKQALMVRDAFAEREIRLIPYINRPETDIEIKVALRRFNHIEGFAGKPIFVDASIGRGQHLRELKRHHQVMREPCWDKGHPEDFRDAILIASDHYTQTLKGPNNWREIPTDGSGPEVFISYHEHSVADVFNWWETCKLFRWHYLVPADYFRNGIVLRSHFI